MTTNTTHPQDALQSIREVMGWICETLPVPTKGATANAMKLDKAIAALSQQAPALTDERILSEMERVVDTQGYDVPDEETGALVQSIVLDTVRALTSPQASQSSQQEREDAARYRWLGYRAKREGRDGGWWGYYSLPLIDGWNHSKANGAVFDHQTLDAAIDAARAQEKA